MDTQAINSAGNPKAPAPKTQSSSSKPVSSSAPQPAGDSVSLSVEAKALAQVSAGASSTSEQRKLSVTDDNDVVLKVIDPKTQEVVRSIPSEEQMQLKINIRDGVNNITE
jgi:uncharacterized FlaG/YvyC family protein